MRIARLEGELAEALTEPRARAGAAEARAETAEEAAATEKAIAALASLAERLVLAQERARPWWRRLVG
jgi:hypothetical protein